MSCQRHEDKATRVDGDREEARSTPSAEQETRATLVYSVCNWSVTAGFGFENSSGKSRARLTRRLLLFAKSDTETGIPSPMAANRPHFPSRSRYVKRIAHPKKRHRQQTKRCTSTARALLRTHQRSESRSPMTVPPGEVADMSSRHSLTPAPRAQNTGESVPHRRQVQRDWAGVAVASFLLAGFT